MSSPTNFTLIIFLPFFSSIPYLLILKLSAYILFIFVISACSTCSGNSISIVGFLYNSFASEFSFKITFASISFSCIVFNESLFISKTASVCVSFNFIFVSTLFIFFPTIAYDISCICFILFSCSSLSIFIAFIFIVPTFCGSLVFIFIASTSFVFISISPFSSASVSLFISAILFSVFESNISILPSSPRISSILFLLMLICFVSKFSFDSSCNSIFAITFKQFTFIFTFSVNSLWFSSYNFPL